MSGQRLRAVVVYERGRDAPLQTIVGQLRISGAKGSVYPRNGFVEIEAEEPRPHMFAIPSRCVVSVEFLPDGAEIATVRVVGSADPMRVDVIPADEEAGE